MSDIPTTNHTTSWSILARGWKFHVGDYRDEFTKAELAEIRRRYQESQERPLKLADLRASSLWDVGAEDDPHDE